MNGHKTLTILCFQQKSVKEFMEFSSKVLGERTGLGERQSVKEGEYMVHAYASASTSLVGIAFTCQEYQQRVAHNLLTKILEDFAAQVITQTAVNSFRKTSVQLEGLGCNQVIGTRVFSN